MSTHEDRAAEQYRKALIKAAAAEEGHACALALLADELDHEGLGHLAAALWEVSRHRRAQVVKHRAIVGAISGGSER